MPLSDIKIKSLKPKDKRYQTCDSDGLYIEVMTSGKKYWRLNYFKNGKRSWHTIGEYPATSLQEARERRNDLRKKLREGESIEKIEKTEANSFGAVAAEWADAHDKKISNPRDRMKTRGRMNNHLLPFLENIPIRDIKPRDLLPVFQRLADRENWEMLSRIRSITSQIFRYAIATDRAEADPVPALRGAIITPQRRHYPYLKRREDIGEMLRRVDSYPYSIVRCATLFLVLTFQRPGNIRAAEWSEIEWDKCQWYISEGKMKMRRDHIVPLSRQSLELLCKMRRSTGDGKYIFPSNRTPNRPMSDATILAALRAIGYTKEEIVPHGIRATASTQLNENGFNRDWIEKQLAHEESNSVRDAYNHAEYLPERRKMMQWWADYLDELRQSAP
jgi:integrase